MAHDEQLRLVAEFAHEGQEAAQVHVVERGLDLVHHVEGRGPAAEHREQEGQRGHRALAAREQRHPPDIAAGRAHLYLDAGVEEIVGLQEDQPTRAAREQHRDQRREVLVHVGRGGGERRHDLVIERAHDLVEFPPRAAHVVDLCLELLVALLEDRELFEREGVDGAERDELALQLLGVLDQRRALGRLGLGQAGQLLGHRTEVTCGVLVQCLDAQLDLVGLEVERARAVAHSIETLLGRVAVLAQLFEPLAAGPHRVDLVLIVVT